MGDGMANEMWLEEWDRLTVPRLSSFGIKTASFR
jgi:hypothetical protein